MTAVSVFLVRFDESINYTNFTYIYIYILCSVQYLFIVCNLIVYTFSIMPVLHLLYINVLNVHFLYKERKGSY